MKSYAALLATLMKAEHTTLPLLVITLAYGEGHAAATHTP